MSGLSVMDMHYIYQAICLLHKALEGDKDNVNDAVQVKILKEKLERNMKSATYRVV